LTDADLSTPIEDLERLERELGRAPVVLGSRALESSEITLRQPFYREAMGKTFNWILRRLGLVRFRDTQCGFKLLEGEAGRRLFSELTIERFAYDVELVLLAERHGLAVREVGVRWADSAASRVNPLVDSARMLWDVLRLSLRRRKPRPR
jgi:dolichyl-phosphate beta-glucosyltransferase